MGLSNGINDMTRTTKIYWIGQRCRAPAKPETKCIDQRMFHSSARLPTWKHHFQCYAPRVTVLHLPAPGVKFVLDFTCSPSVSAMSQHAMKPAHSPNRHRREIDTRNIKSVRARSEIRTEVPWSSCTDSILPYKMSLS